MCFDLVVLVLNAYKLLGINSKNQGFGASRIAKMIFEDGLIFFFIAYAKNNSTVTELELTPVIFRFLANLLATVFMLLDLNQIMSVIFNVPAAVASTVSLSPITPRVFSDRPTFSSQIVACRVVRRLTNFTNQGPEI